MKEIVADIILPLPLKSDFTYRVPEEMQDKLKPGMRVLVNFGKRKVFTGVVRRLRERIRPAGPQTLKPIDDLLDETPVILPTQIAFFDWMAFYYFCTPGEVLNAALPNAMKPESSLRIEPVPGLKLHELELNDKEFILLDALIVRPALTIQEVSDIWNVEDPGMRLKNMAARKLIRLVERVEEKYKPKTERVYKLSAEYSHEDAIHSIFDSLKNAPKQEEVMMLVVSAFMKELPLAKKDIAKKIKGADAALRSLVEKGFLDELEIRVDRLEFFVSGKPKREILLNIDQLAALAEIKHSFAENPEKPVLLHGITGSGKTHIYIDLIRDAIKDGKQALYLLPEIAITKQIIERIQNEFGERAGVYHSRFTDAERFEIWHHVLNRKYDVIVGVRSSIFLPFHDLGIIVVDEEHENSFKQNEPSPRYHARDSALYLSRLMKCPVLLGSATPSFESYHNAETGKFTLVELHSRAVEARLPDIVLVDMREQKKKKLIEGSFSEPLRTEINDKLFKREQVILFQNRRGYSPVLVCGSCSHVPRCVNCDITLTYHKANKALKCHYCGFTEAANSKCEVCGHYEMHELGFGTERIEEEITVLFPNHKVDRLDLDSTRTKHGFRNIINAFENHETEILVGTQMVTKGLDFANVTLVGVLDADWLLNFADFRAHERAFQLLLQVSGRAGRSTKHGEVLIQTRMPDHIFFGFLKQDYRKFYEHELNYRKRLGYPPFCRLIRIEIKHRDRERLLQEAGVLKSMFYPGFGGNLLGPEFPAVSRIRNRFRMHFLIKVPKEFSAESVRRFLFEQIDIYYKEASEKTLRILVDVDPV